MRRLLLSATLLGTGVTFAAPAWAGCTAGPEIICTGYVGNGVIGSDITLKYHAYVIVADPYAGASARFDTILLLNDGVLRTEGLSYAGDTISGMTVVRTYQNAQIFHDGQIRADLRGSAGVVLGRGSSISVGSGGIIMATAHNYALPFQNTAMAIGASGADTKINVSGYVASLGDNVAAIRPVTWDLFGPQTFATSVTVEAGGQVLSSGSNAPAIWVPGGSNIAVKGTVRASGVASNAIFYHAGTGPLTVDLLAGGNISATQAPAIAGDGANVALTIAGTLSGPAANQNAVALGSGNDRVTIRDGANITGIVSAGGGVDTLELSSGGARSFKTSQFAGFEQLAVSSGQWTADAVLTGFSTIAVQNATLSGTQAATIESTGGSLSVTNEGTIFGGSAWAIRSTGSSADSVTNAGVIQGGAAGAIDLGDGDDSLVLHRTSAIGGKVHGGTGTDTVTLVGTGSTVLMASQLIDFEKLVVESGQWMADVELTGYNSVAVGNATLWGSQAVTIASAGPPLTVTNEGTILGGTAWAIQATGNGADSITNAGTITGGATGAIDLGGGDDALVLLAASVLNGRVDGGAGTDSVTLSGNGGTLGRVENFETLTVNGAGWTLSQPSTFANGMSIAANASLSGSVANLSGSVAIAGTLTVDQSTDGTLAAALSGNGTLIKSGSGMLTIGNQSAFAGQIRVAAGRLALGGATPASIFVQNGGMLSGNGSAGATTIATGGTIAPGNSIGTLTINGNFAQQAGSIYAVETTAAGQSDLITVNGAATIATGAQLVVTRDVGTYQPGTRYTVLTATGGVSGSYTLVQTIDPLTEFRLGGTANSIYLDVARTVLGMVPVASTTNQSAALAGVTSLGIANQVNTALSMTLSDDDIRSSLDNLSGEIHATVLPAATKDAQVAQDAALNHPRGKDAGTGLWVQGLYREGSNDGEAGSGRVRSDSHGILGGVDLPVGDQLRLGVAGGYSRAALQLDSRASSARIESTHILAYGDLMLGKLRLRGAGGYAWLKNRANRTVVLPGLNNALLAIYNGGAFHGVAEIAYALPFAGGSIEPFASLEGYKVETDAFVETGGAAALRREARTETYVISTLGGRFEAPLTGDLSAKARLGWRHTHGNRDGSSLMQFASGGSAFRVTGAPLSRNAAAGALDLLWRPTADVAVSVGYAGMTGSAGDDHAAKIGLSIGF